MDRPSGNESSDRRQRSRGGLSDPGSERLIATVVFDNLYYLGTGQVSAWLIGTDEGYILIDALNDENDAQKRVIDGMHALGLDPSAIRYILITHAHGDHFGGARYLTSELGITVAMSDADWQLAAMLPPHPRFGLPPDRDTTVREGDHLTVGQTSVTIRITPGHTAGTVSPIFTVYDNGIPHTVALWGGTGFNFGSNPEAFDVYARSAVSFRKLAEASGVDVFLSNHPARDGTAQKIEKLAARGPGEPHPFVLGPRALEAFTVLENCAAAQSARLSVIVD